MKFTLDTWRWFYARHIQKTFGAILAGCASYDVMAALTQWAPDLRDLLGGHVYGTLRGVCAVAIVVRAVFKPQPPGPPSGGG